MSYSCTKCGKFLFAPGKCFKCAAPAKLVATESELEVVSADRDLYRARCEAIVAMLEPGPINVMTATDAEFAVWKTKNDLQDAAVKIMKGEE